ncbi:RNA-binding protein 34 [Anthonomus grandis grandis]|uniref:RNA-binding protein 34 n=1 Tax=Anthonomus grandis grandis TaxID=2921223 RepID=UPI00216665B0|nr:RNA-binding protein 34 [Anthonomus grandis grandis]
MEYSVGSLADLISGQKTTNKPKVVQKKFVPIKKVKTQPPDTSSKPDVKQKAKKTIKGEASPTESKFIKKVDKPKLKTSFKAKNKLKEGGKFKKSPSNKTEKSNGPSPKKPKNKRKLNNSEIDVADSDTEESSPKKPKLSVNEQNAAGRIKNKKNKEIKNSSEYKDRTLFVGNIPITIKKKQIKAHFQKYGPIDTIRIRGIAVADPNTSKKIAAIKKEFHPDRKTVYCFIRFNNPEDAKKAEAENGALFMEHHIRVNCCESNDKPDESKAIFVGNMPFNVEDEELWNLFKPCGPISHIRVVRDGRTGMGKGFGYVNFQDGDGAQVALEMGTVKLRDRELRISACDNNMAKKQKTGKKPRHRNQRRPKTEETNVEGSEKKPESKGAFGGTKFTDKKKKRKFSKATNQKKTLAQKLTAPGPKSVDQ